MTMLTDWLSRVNVVFTIVDLNLDVGSRLVENDLVLWGHDLDLLVLGGGRHLLHHDRKAVLFAAVLREEGVAGRDRDAVGRSVEGLNLAVVDLADC